MIAQTVVFAGLAFWLGNGLHSNGENSADAAGTGVFFAFILTLIIFGAINLVQNYLIRRRAKSRLSANIGLSDKPDHGRYSARSAGAVLEDGPEIIEIPGREQPRKISGPLP